MMIIVRERRRSSIMPGHRSIRVEAFFLFNNA